jgi:hypothetical protein
LNVSYTADNKKQVLSNSITFYERLVVENSPDWLKEVPLPSPLTSTTDYSGLSVEINLWGQKIEVSDETTYYGNNNNLNSFVRNYASFSGKTISG